MRKSTRPSALILEAPSSHLYPGSALRLRDGTLKLPSGQSRKCLVIFADGSTAAATLRRTGTQYRLMVESYLTKRKTMIAPKGWTLEPNANALTLRVRTKIPPA